MPPSVMVWIAIPVMTRACRSSYGDPTAIGIGGIAVAKLLEREGVRRYGDYGDLFLAIRGVALGSLICAIGSGIDRADASFDRGEKIAVTAVSPFRQITFALKNGDPNGDLTAIQIGRRCIIPTAQRRVLSAQQKNEGRAEAHPQSTRAVVENHQSAATWAPARARALDRAPATTIWGRVETVALDHGVLCFAAKSRPRGAGSRRPGRNCRSAH